jgi:hypothetical protein
MPERGAIDRLAAALAPSPAGSSPGSAEVVGFQSTDPNYAALERWIDRNGASTYLLWLVTHPGYVVAEPFQRPEQTYNDAHGQLTFYAAPGYGGSPLTDLLWPAWWWLVPMTLVGVGAALITGTARQRSWLMVAGLGLLGVPAMLIAWHGDGQEVPRHTIEGFAQVRIGVLIVCLVGVLRLLSRRRDVSVGTGSVRTGSVRTGSVRTGQGPEATGQTDGRLAQSDVERR